MPPRLAFRCAARVPVQKKPGVCLLITGNELLKPGEKPEGSKIVDSNSIMLKMLDGLECIEDIGPGLSG